MAKFEAAEKRILENLWICLKCNAKNRSQPGKKAAKCRKCGSKKLRLKRKQKKG